MAPGRHSAFAGCRLSCLLALALIGVAGGDGVEPALRGVVVPQQKSQVLIFDAGSSGTRVHIFDMMTPNSPSRAHVPIIDMTVRDAQTKKVRPGLSSFAEKMDLEGCQKNMEELLTFASQFVPADKRAETPVMLKATAGLRSVAAEQANAVLKTVRTVLSQSGYKFQDEWADIIKGKEEGGLAWVAANYLQGAFTEECFQNNIDYDGPNIGSSQAADRLECQLQCKEMAGCEHFAFWPDGNCYLHDASKPLLRRRPGVVIGPKVCEATSVKKTLGVIEMGGGSTQVTFQVPEEEQLQPDDRFVFETARGKKYYLYAHSYLGYGQDHAQVTMNKHLQQVQEDPCYPIGYVRQASVAGGSKRKTLIQGAGDSTKCGDVLGQGLLSDELAPGRYASELPLRGNFIATENFFYVQNDLKLSLEGTLVDPDKLGAIAAKACHKELEPSDSELSEMATGKSNPNKPNYCFGTSYQAKLLEVLKVPTTSSAMEVRIMHKIKGGDVDWAIGAAIVHYLEDLRSKGGWQPEIEPDAGGGLFPYIALLVGIGVVPIAWRAGLGEKCREEILPQFFSQGMDGSFTMPKVSPTSFGTSSDRRVGG